MVWFTETWRGESKLIITGFMLDFLQVAEMGMRWKNLSDVQID